MNFLKQSIIHPKSTGAIAPSSSQLAELICRKARIRSGDVVVELGPGTGVFTEQILSIMPADSQYLGIEINEDFVVHLQETYPQAAIRRGAAEDIQMFLDAVEQDKCDRIISGLPWAAFRPDRQTNLLETLHDTLPEGGLFLTFSYTPFHYLPRGRAFRSALEDAFSTVHKTNSVFNVPPAFVYVCEK